jgi:thymidylate synthase
MNSFSYVWQDLIARLDRCPVTESRNGPVQELLGDTLRFAMSTAVLAIKERKLRYAFMYREAWWILSGRNDVSPLTELIGRTIKYSDDGVRFTGAYGPKIVDQMRYVVQTLVKDPESRQAVINIWRESPAPSRDIPCTTSVQFLIRNGTIHTVVTMRSSDVWLGLPYDVFTFTMLTCLVALELHIQTNKAYTLGEMIHTAGSRHLYEVNHSAAMHCLNADIADWPRICTSQILGMEPFDFLNDLFRCSLSPNHTWTPINS